MIDRKEGKKMVKDCKRKILWCYEIDRALKAIGGKLEMIGTYYNKPKGVKRRRVYAALINTTPEQQKDLKTKYPLVDMFTGVKKCRYAPELNKQVFCIRIY